MARPLAEQGGKLDSEQRKVVKRIIGIGKRRGESPRDIVTALITGIQESGLRNLAGGDADSEGWRQERRMYYPNPRNVKASVNRFYDELDKAGPGTVGERAQAVQRSAYPGAYQPHVAEARTLLRRFNRKVGGGPQTASQSVMPGKGQKVGPPVKPVDIKDNPDYKLAALDFIKNRDKPGAAIAFAQQKKSIEASNQARRVPQKEVQGKGSKQRLLKPNQSAKTSGTPLSGDALTVGKKLEKMFGVTVTSSTGGNHVPGSYHYQGRAVDIGGTPDQMMKAYKYLVKNLPLQKKTELFYDPAGFYFDNSTKIKGKIGGHSDHIHLAI